MWCPILARRKCLVVVISSAMISRILVIDLVMARPSSSREAFLHVQSWICTVYVRTAAARRLVAGSATGPAGLETWPHETATLKANSRSFQYLLRMYTQTNYVSLSISLASSHVFTGTPKEISNTKEWCNVGLVGRGGALIFPIPCPWELKAQLRKGGKNNQKARFYPPSTGGGGGCRLPGGADMPACWSRFRH